MPVADALEVAAEILTHAAPDLTEDERLVREITLKPSQRGDWALRVYLRGDDDYIGAVITPE